jgi:hypothetical protein
MLGVTWASLCVFAKASLKSPNFKASLDLVFNLLFLFFSFLSQLDLQYSNELSIGCFTRF